MGGTLGVGVSLFGNGLVMLFYRALIQLSAVKLDLLLNICWILQKDIVLMLRKFLRVFIIGAGNRWGRPASNSWDAKRPQTLNRSPKFGYRL